MLDFHVDVTLEGEPLSDDEITLHSWLETESLVLLAGGLGRD